MTREVHSETALKEICYSVNRFFVRIAVAVDQLSSRVCLAAGLERASSA
jgi:hypothetical protein